MCVILLAEIALATTASIDHRALKETLRTGFLYTIHTYEANKDAWDYVQKEVRGKSIFRFFPLFPRFSLNQILTLLMFCSLGVAVLLATRIGKIRRYHIHDHVIVHQTSVICTRKDVTKQCIHSL